MNQFLKEDPLYGRYKAEKILNSAKFILIMLKFFAIVAAIYSVLSQYSTTSTLKSEIVLILLMIIAAIYLVEQYSAWSYLLGQLISLLILVRILYLGIWRHPEYMSVYLGLSCFYLWRCHLEFVYSRIQGYSTILFHAFLWCFFAYNTNFIKSHLSPDVALAIFLLVILQLIWYGYQINKEYEELSRKIELEISHSNAKNLINAIPEGIAVLNANLEILMSNNSNFKLLQGQDIFRLKINEKFKKKDSDECMELGTHVRKFKESEEVTTIFGVCAINNYYLECTGSKTQWNKELAIVLTFREVSKIIKLQSEVSLNSNTLRILQGVSHELKTPLNKIINDHRSIICSSEAMTEAVREHLTKSFSSANYLLHLIKDMIDYSHIKFNNLGLNFEWVFVDDIILECVEMHRNINKDYTIVYKNKILEDLKMYTDSSRFKQCMLNLISFSLG